MESTISMAVCDCLAMATPHAFASMLGEIMITRERDPSSLSRAHLLTDSGALQRWRSPSVPCSWPHLDCASPFARVEGSRHPPAPDGSGLEVRHCRQVVSKVKRA